MEQLVWPVSPVARGLRLLGLWLPPPGRRPRHLLVLGAVLLGHAFLLATSAASLVMDTHEDLPQLSFTAYNALTCLGLIAKVVSFSLDGARLARLLELLAECRVRFPDGQGRRGQHHATAVRLHRLLQVSYRVNSAVWMFAPVVSALIARRSHDGAPARRAYVLPLWLPLDTQASPAYEVVYAAQVASGWALSETTVLLDGALLALMLHAAAELAVLNDSLSAGGRAPDPAPQDAAVAALPEVRDDLPKDSTGAPRDPRQEQMLRQLVSSIQHHQVIIAYMGLLQSVVSRSISVLLACNTVTICFHIIATVAVMQEDIELVGMTKMLVGSTLYAYQTAILCLLGQRITSQSERLPASAYGSAWWEGDRHYRKLLVVFCERASRALSIRVCGLYSLSKETLLQVLKAAYSLFNFMYQAVETSSH